MNHPEPIDDLLLERFALGELPEAQAEALRRAIDADPSLRARLDELRASSAAILERYPARELAGRIEERAARAARRAQRTSTHRSWLLVVPALAAASLVGIALVGEQGGLDPGVEITRPKGNGPKLAIHRKHGEASEQLRSGAPARAGDTLQVSYLAGGRRFGVIVSIDGRGDATLHFPAQPGGSTALQAEREAALPAAFELDDAPHFERFFFVTGDEPLDAARVLQSARVLARSREAAAAPLPVDAAEQVSFMIRKVP